MNSPTASPEPSSSAPPPSSLWKRVAAGVAVFLLCYFVVAYVIVPQIWKSYARLRPSFDDNPRLTKTGDGHPGDALNVALTGTESELEAIMLPCHASRRHVQVVRQENEGGLLLDFSKGPGRSPFRRHRAFKIRPRYNPLVILDRRRVGNGAAIAWFSGVK